MAYHCMICGKDVNLHSEGVIIKGWDKVICGKCLGVSIQDL